MGCGVRWRYGLHDFECGPFNRLGTSPDAVLRGPGRRARGAGTGIPYYGTFFLRCKSQLPFGWKISPGKPHRARRRRIDCPRTIREEGAPLRKTVFLYGRPGQYPNYQRALEAAGAAVRASLDPQDASPCAALLLPGGGGRGALALRPPQHRQPGPGAGPGPGGAPSAGAVHGGGAARAGHLPGDAGDQRVLRRARWSRTCRATARRRAGTGSTGCGRPPLP